MPLTVQCNLCSSDPANPQKSLISSQIIPRSEPEAHHLLAVELTNHIQTRHPKALQEIAESMPVWATFGLLKHFTADEQSQAFEKEKERMRDTLIDQVMLGATEDEDEEEELEDNEDEEEELEEVDDIDFGEEEEELEDGEEEPEPYPSVHS